MIEIFACNIPDQLDRYVFASLLDELPEFIQTKILKYRRWQDQQEHVLSKILLLIAIRRFSHQRASLKDLKFTATNRPFLDSQFDFNISHSSGCVACCISTVSRVGIDSERIQEVDLNDYHNHIHNDELIRIHHATSPPLEFFRYWTKLEAVIKADGRGVGIPLKEISFTQDGKCFLSGKIWQLHQVNLFKNHISHLATEVCDDYAISVHLFDIESINRSLNLHRKL